MAPSVSAGDQFSFCNSHSCVLRRCSSAFEPLGCSTGRPTWICFAISPWHRRSPGATPGRPLLPWREHLVHAPGTSAGRSRVESLLLAHPGPLHPTRCLAEPPRSTDVCTAGGPAVWPRCRDRSDVRLSIRPEPEGPVVVVRYILALAVLGQSGSERVLRSALGVRSSRRDSRAETVCSVRSPWRNRLSGPRCSGRGARRDGGAPRLPAAAASHTRRSQAVAARTASGRRERHRGGQSCPDIDRRSLSPRRAEPGTDALELGAGEGSIGGPGPADLGDGRGRRGHGRLGHRCSPRAGAAGIWHRSRMARWQYHLPRLLLPRNRSWAPPDRAAPPRASLHQSRGIGDRRIRGFRADPRHVGGTDATNRDSLRRARDDPGRRLARPSRVQSTRRVRAEELRPRAFDHPALSRGGVRVAAAQRLDGRRRARQRRDGADRGGARRRQGGRSGAVLLQPLRPPGAEATGAGRDVRRSGAR